MFVSYHEHNHENLHTANWLLRQTKGL